MRFRQVGKGPGSLDVSKNFSCQRSGNASLLIGRNRLPRPTLKPSGVCFLDYRAGMSNRITNGRSVCGTGDLKENHFIVRFGSWRARTPTRYFSHTNEVQEDKRRQYEYAFHDLLPPLTRHGFLPREILTKPHFEGGGLSGHPQNHPRNSRGFGPEGLTQSSPTPSAESVKPDGEIRHIPNPGNSTRFAM